MSDPQSRSFGIALAALALCCACASSTTPQGPEKVAVAYLDAQRYPDALRESEKLSDQRVDCEIFLSLRGQVRL